MKYVRTLADAWAERYALEQQAQAQLRESSMIRLAPPFDSGPQVTGQSARLVAGGDAQLLVNVSLTRPVRGMLTLQAPLAASPSWVVEQGSGYALLREVITPTAEVTRIDVACSTVRVSGSVSAADATMTAIYGVQS